MTSTVLFVCQHGAAKSVLAAELLRRGARRRGIRVRAVARGVEPDASRSDALRVAMPEAARAIANGKPRRISLADIQRAETVVTFDLAPDHLPAPAAASEAWDGVPAVSADPAGARRAIEARVERLLDEIER